VSVEVLDNANLERYEAWLDGDLAGFAQYRVQGGRITLFHTEVEPEYEGQGVGSALAKFALDDVRERGLELLPTCPFIADYVRRHADDYLELVRQDMRDRVMAAG
jgi:predicted GNAT family acetyltransferase